MGQHASIGISLQGPHAGMDARDSLQTMAGLLDVVTELERNQAGQGPRSAMSRWTFSELRLGSVQAVLEPLQVSEQSSFRNIEITLRQLIDGFDVAERMPEIPPNWTPDVARRAATAVRKLGASVDVGMKLSLADGTRVRVTQRAHQNLTQALKTTFASFGARRGHLGGLNDITQGNKIKAILTTDVGNERIPLQCPEELREQLRAAWGCDRVEVTGRIMENARGQVVRIDVSEIEALPTEASLRVADLGGGFWPDMTGGLSAREHLEAIRGEA